jgi:O-antigen/teichoic acid export membrane protein
MDPNNLIKRFLKYFSESRSVGNDFFSLASGSVLVLVIQFILTPFLSRIYEPEAYGVFSVYSALLNTLIIISTLGMKNALMLPKNKFIFLNLLRLNFLLILGVCSTVAVILYPFGAQLTILLQVQELGMAVYFIPLIAAMAASTEILASWHIKSGDFRTGPFTRVVANLLSRSLSIGYGVGVSNLWWGLLGGDVISRLFAFCFLSFKRFWRYIKLFGSAIHSQKLRTVFFSNLDFIIYNFPSNLLSSLSGQLPIYLTGLCFGSQYVGYLGFAISLLYIPLNIIGNSVYTVFYQRAAQLGKGHLMQVRALTQKVISKIINISALPFILLIGYGDYLFGWFLGQNWVEAGQIARFLGFYYLIYLIYLSVSAVFTILTIQKYLLWVQVLSLLTGVVSFAIGCYYEDPHFAFLLYGVLGVGPYLIALVILYKKLNLSLKTFFLKILIILISITAICSLRAIH